MRYTINTDHIPDYIKKTAAILIENGFQSYLVGGAVRDLLLGRVPKDFDIATNATPEQVAQLYPKVITTGARFGNVVVIANNGKGENVDIDITTFREEESYFGGRWPAKVSFTQSIEQDLSRRDFTINALALNVKTINSQTQINTKDIIDPFNGIGDMSNSLIRAVRSAEERLKEDGLRSFKACRIASELNFEIDTPTKNAIYKTRYIASQVSAERITQELKKMIYYSPLPSKGIRLLDECGLLKIIIPELELTKNITQPEWHSFDLFNHSLTTLDKCDDTIRLAGLLHDIGKIKTISKLNNETHFYSHAEVGSIMAKQTLERLHMDNKTVQQTINLIKWHMFEFETDNENAISNKGIKKFILKVGGIENINKLLKLRIADAYSTGRDFDATEIDLLQKRITEVLKNESIITLETLNLRGQDLINLGYMPGPQISKILNSLLEIVNDRPDKNTYQQLASIAKLQFPILQN